MPDNPTPEPQAAPVAPQLPPDVLKSLESLISRAGGSDAASALLFNDNKELRDQLRDLKAKLPKEGTVVLSQDEAAELAAYRAYGKPDELKQRLDEGESAKQIAAQAAREKTIAKAAGVLGLQNNALLQTLLNSVELEVAGDNENPSVIVKDGEKQVPFADYAKSRPDFEAALPALQAQAAPARGGSFVKQGVNGSNPTSVFDRIRHEVKEKQEAQKPEARDLRLAGIS